MTDAKMDEKARLLASAQGLEKTLALFESDVMAAAQHAEKLRERMAAEKPLAPAEEPWVPTPGTKA